jgi:hypothetical protein
MGMRGLVKYVAGYKDSYLAEHLINQKNISEAVVDDSIDRVETYHILQLADYVELKLRPLIEFKKCNQNKLIGV